jgi:hypothetical protein
MVSPGKYWHPRPSRSFVHIRLIIWRGVTSHFGKSLLWFCFSLFGVDACALSVEENHCSVRTRVRFLAGARNFCLHHRVQNGSGALPVSYPVGTGGSFPGDKSGLGVKLTTHHRLVPRSRMCGAIPPLPQYVFTAWCLVKQRDNFIFYLYLNRMFLNRIQFNTMHPVYVKPGINKLLVLRWHCNTEMRVLWQLEYEYK